MLRITALAFPNASFWQFSRRSGGASPPARLLMIRLTWDLSFMASFMIFAVSSIVSGTSMPGVHFVEREGSMSQEQTPSMTPSTLRIKAFYGTSENAVKTQIWIAISVYVLVAIVKKTLQLKGSPFTILQILSVSLFLKTPLFQLLSPIEPDEKENDSSNQLKLP